MTRPRFDLFFISGLVLFLELACIRWFPAHVLFLTFFTNTVLLACFVGMSVGCLTARSPRRHLVRTPFLLAMALAIGLLLNAFRSRLEHYVNVGNQAQPEVVFFGAEANALKTPEFLVPVELVAGGMFLLIAAIMVGPGQEMGRAFTRVPDRVTAYTMNILGSLVGIALFALCSWFQMPPPVWFLLVGAGILYFLNQRKMATDPQPYRYGSAAVLLGCVLITVPTAGIVPIATDRVQIFWSPYYRIDYVPPEGGIVTNLIGHQVMVPRDTPTEIAYHLPHLFHKNVGRPPVKRVLIIGAGSGNDISRTLLWAAPDATIDAVDIEPVIQRIGRQHHPDRPYDDPRVTAHLDDGRNFLRRAPSGEYDLVIYALVDSLVLHSGYGNIRLESYLFTQQAFADVQRVLKPDGAFAVYNYFRQGWIVARLRDTLQSTFGAVPVALTNPPTDVVAIDEFQVVGGGGVFTMFYAGSEEVVGPLRRKFSEEGPLWVPMDVPVRPDTPCTFSKTPPPPQVLDHNGAGTHTRWAALNMAKVADSAGTIPPATDVWPFLYTRRPMMPGYLLRGIGLMILLSLLLWLIYRPRTSEVAASATGLPADLTGSSQLPRETGLLIRMFFLGAGFMLIETKAIVHMALLFGSTWMVNTVVFFAILLTILLANLFVSAVRPKRIEWAYVGLFAALVANMLIPLDAFLGMDRTTQIVAACSLVFAPVAFAGVIFPVSFARSQAPDRAFGANVAGALVGGLAENTSMLLGFQYLLLVAIGFYLVSTIGGAKAVADDKAGKLPV